MIATVVSNLVFMPVMALYVREVSRERRLAQRRLQEQAWHLRQLLPASRPVD
jgi:hypothetical protein